MNEVVIRHQQHLYEQRQKAAWSKDCLREWMWWYRINKEEEGWKFLSRLIDKM